MIHFGRDKDGERKRRKKGAIEVLWHGMGMVCPGLMTIYGTLEASEAQITVSAWKQFVWMGLVRSFIHSYMYVCMYYMVMHVCMYVCMYMEGNLGGGGTGTGGRGTGGEGGKGREGKGSVKGSFDY